MTPTSISIQLSFLAIYPLSIHLVFLKWEPSMVLRKINIISFPSYFFLTTYPQIVKSIIYIIVNCLVHCIWYKIFVYWWFCDLVSDLVFCVDLSICNLWMQELEFCTVNSFYPWCCSCFSGICIICTLRYAKVCPYQRIWNDSNSLKDWKKVYNQSFIFCEKSSRVVSCFVIWSLIALLNIILLQLITPVNYK